MKPCRQILLFALMIGAIALPQALAQSGRKIQKREDPVLRISTIEVQIPVNVYDAEGRNATDLTTRDLIVVENGEPRTVTALRHDPASIVLILDLSNEIGTFKNGASEQYQIRDPKAPTEKGRPVWEQRYEIVPRPAAREFADNFIRNLGDGDQIAIIQYSDKVQLIQDWTADRNEALDSIQSKYRIGLKSRYHDALGLAAAKLDSRTGRRVVVLLTDGLDSASKTSRRQAMTALEQSGASIFVVGWDELLKYEITGAMSWMGAHERQGTALLKRLKELRGYLQDLDMAAYDLRELAQASGGEMMSPPDFDQLVKKVPDDLHREVGAQYNLAFLTERGGNLEPERTVQVIPARPGLSARSRRTYRIGPEDSSN
jgi:VWFA-related protein